MFDNKKLFDVLTRHQIYVEGVKAFYQKDFNETIKQIDREVTLLLSKITYKTMDGLNKGALNALLRDLKSSQLKIYSEYSQKLVDELQAFMSADITISKSIFVASKKPDEVDDEIPDEEETDNELDLQSEENKNSAFFPLLWFKSKVNGGAPDKVWSSISNTAIPANGVLPSAFISSFATSAATSVENIIRKGYANKTEVSEVLKQIRGTKSLNYNDGQLKKIFNQQGAVSDTLIQHVTSIVQAAIASIFYDKYQWISVLDSRTTPICRSRNNKIFEYGKGPLPPAHIRCRSKTKPVAFGPTNHPDNFGDFMKTQPKAFADDIMQGVKTDDSQQTFKANPLSVSEFLKKLKLILKP